MSSWREQPNTLHLEALVNVSKVEGDLWACADVLSQMIWAQMDYRWLWVLASFSCIPVDYFVPISDITVPMIANEMEASALCTTVLKYHHTNVLPRRLLNWTRGDPSSVTPIGTASGCQAWSGKISAVMLHFLCVMSIMWSQLGRYAIGLGPELGTHGHTVDPETIGYQTVIKAEALKRHPLRW